MGADLKELLEKYQRQEPGAKNKMFYFGPAREDLCPTCGGRVVDVCRCPKANRVCENGHEWHRDSSGRVIMGSGH